MEDFMNTNFKRRELGLSIILSIITCGIYGLYWIACVNDDVNFALNEQDTSGAMVVILSIVTCSIYLYFWAYKIGTKMIKLKTMQANGGYVDTNSPILFLVLAIFGLNIVNLALIQNDLNKISTL